MIIRPASVGDIERCERLDASYDTSQVWQMEIPTGRVAPPPGQMGASFRRTKIPRRMLVPYPRSVDGLLRDCQSNGCFVVADELGVIQGFLDMTVDYWQWQGWIEHLVVDRPYRRRGLASLMLDAVEHWAQGSGLRGIIAVAQTKNDPAISFFSARGYTFCGFIDAYFTNGDVGLLYRLAF